MKTTKSLLSVLLALTPVFALCTCGGKTAAPEQSTDEAPAAEPETSSNLDEFAGEYTFIETISLVNQGIIGNTVQIRIKS